jgi:hypothetical protein
MVTSHATITTTHAFSHATMTTTQCVQSRDHRDHHDNTCVQSRDNNTMRSVTRQQHHAFSHATTTPCDQSHDNNTMRSVTRQQHHAISHTTTTPCDQSRTKYDVVQTNCFCVLRIIIDLDRLSLSMSITRKSPPSSHHHHAPLACTASIITFLHSSNISIERNSKTNHITIYIC